MKVILLEDSATMRDVFEMSLRAMMPGVEVITVPDMTEFLESRWGCDAAVLDVNTPAVGEEIIESISQHMPIPHCTWSDTMVDGVQGFRKTNIQGVADWLATIRDEQS